MIQRRNSSSKKKVFLKMRTTCAAIATASVLGSFAPALAATSEGDFAVYGWGARDCNTIIAILDGEQAAQAQGQLAEWISGYISGQNRNIEGVYDLTPIKTHYPLVSLARNVCANNGDQLFENVVYAIVDTFAAMRLPANSPVVAVSHKGQSVTVNESTVLLVQQFLVEAGILGESAADGQFGPQTAQALESWQESANLTVNGLPDMVTLFLMAQQSNE